MNDRYVTKWMMTMEWQTIIQAGYHKLLLTFGQCDLCGANLSNNNSDSQSTTQQSLICSACYADLPLFSPTFTQGDLLNWPAINKALPNIKFDHLFCLAPYITPFSQWLPQFKYQGRFELATFFAKLLAQHWQKQSFAANSPVDLVLSVPLHISKWQRRGFNQAHLVAKTFAQLLRLPYDENALLRSKKNQSQVGKTGTQRRNTLANSFALTKVLPNKAKHVILLDDVLTTGSTANEIIKLLKQSGIEKVTVITVCLTLPKN